MPAMAAAAALERKRRTTPVSEKLGAKGRPTAVHSHDRRVLRGGSGQVLQLSLPLLDRYHTFIAVILGPVMCAGIGGDKCNESCGLGSLKTPCVKFCP